MEEYIIIEDNMTVIKDPKTFCFNFAWPKIKQDISMETIFMNTENRKTNDPYKFVLNFSQKLDLKSSDKNVTLQNVFIY